MGRSAHEVFLLAACVLSGAIGLLVPSSQSKAIVYSFPVWAQSAWYVGILFGGILSISGILGGGVTGMLTERAGQLMLSGLATAFGAAAITYAGFRGGVGASVLITAFFGAACLARAYEIQSDLNVLRRDLAYLAEQQDTT